MQSYWTFTILLALLGISNELSKIAASLSILASPPGA